MSRGRKGLETRLDVSQLLVCCFFYYIFFLTTHNSIYRIYELYTCRPPPQRVQPLPNRAWTQARAGNRLETRQDVSQSLVCLFLLYHFSICLYFFLQVLQTFFYVSTITLMRQTDSKPSTDTSRSRKRAGDMS